MAKSNQMWPSWSDLPLDILNSIVDRLLFADKVRLKAVCKSWRLANGLKSPGKLPWVMTYSWSKNANDDTVNMICELHDPSQREKHTITCSIRGTKKRIYYGATVCASKRDWVLFSKTYKYTKCCCLVPKTQESTKLFFYNPFSNKIIEVPEFHSKGFKAATFSMTPDCTHCMICALTIRKGKNYISTISLGDKRWRIQFYGLNFEVTSMILVDGTFYWTFGNLLGSFNIARRQLKFYQYLHMAGFTDPHLVESNGGQVLIANSLCNHPFYQRAFGHSWAIFRFDPSRKCWFLQANNSEDDLLFLGATTVSIPAKEEARELAATVHVLDGCMCRSYHPFQLVEEEGYGPQIYDWIHSKSQKMIWIQPPHLKS